MRNKKFCVNHVEETSDNPEKEIEVLEKLISLNDEGEVYFSQYDSEVQEYSETFTFAYINCNDTFAWATADGEQIRTYGDLEDIHEIYAKFGGIGLIAWIAQRRGQRPIVKRGSDITKRTEYQETLAFIEKKYKELGQ